MSAKVAGSPPTAACPYGKANSMSFTNIVSWGPLCVQGQSLLQHLSSPPSSVTSGSSNIVLFYFVLFFYCVSVTLHCTVHCIERCVVCCVVTCCDAWHSIPLHCTLYRTLCCVVDMLWCIPFHSIALYIVLNVVFVLCCDMLWCMTFHSIALYIVLHCRLLCCVALHCRTVTLIKRRTQIVLMNCWNSASNKLFHRQMAKLMPQLQQQHLDVTDTPTLTATLTATNYFMILSRHHARIDWLSFLLADSRRCHIQSTVYDLFTDIQSTMCDMLYRLMHCHIQSFCTMVRPYLHWTVADR